MERFMFYIMCLIIVGCAQLGKKSMERAARLTSAIEIWLLQWCPSVGIHLSHIYTSCPIIEWRSAWRVRRRARFVFLSSVADLRARTHIPREMRAEGNDFLIEWREMMRRLMLGCCRTKAADQKTRANDHLTWVRKSVVCLHVESSQSVEWARFRRAQSIAHLIYLYTMSHHFVHTPQQTHRERRTKWTHHCILERKNSVQYQTFASLNQIF